MQVGHHLLILTLHTILNVINPLLEILKLRTELSIILVHPILYRVEVSITNNCELLYASIKRADIC